MRAGAGGQPAVSPNYSLETASESPALPRTCPPPDASLPSQVTEGPLLGVQPVNPAQRAVIALDNTTLSGDCATAERLETMLHCAGRWVGRCASMVLCGALPDRCQEAGGHHCAAPPSCRSVPGGPGLLVQAGPLAEPEPCDITRCTCAPEWFAVLQV